MIAVFAFPSPPPVFGRRLVGSKTSCRIALRWLHENLMFRSCLSYKSSTNLGVFSVCFFVGLVDDLQSHNAWIWMRQILLGVFFLSKFEETTNKEPTYPIKIFKNQQMIWKLKDLMAGKKPGEGSTLMDLVSWLLPRSELEMDGQKWQKDQNSKSTLFASSFVKFLFVYASKAIATDVFRRSDPLADIQHPGSDLQRKTRFENTHNYSTVIEITIWSTNFLAIFSSHVSGRLVDHFMFQSIEIRIPLAGILGRIWSVVQR